MCELHTSYMNVDEWISVIDSLIIIKKEKILIFLSDLGRDPSNNLSIPQTDTREHPANCLVSTQKKSRNVNNIPPINISIHLLNFDPVNFKNIVRLCTLHN